MRSLETAMALLPSVAPLVAGSGGGGGEDPMTISIEDLAKRFKISVKVCLHTHTTHVVTNYLRCSGQHVIT